MQISVYWNDGREFIWSWEYSTLQLTKIGPVMFTCIGLKGVHMSFKIYKFPIKLLLFGSNPCRWLLVFNRCQLIKSSAMARFNLCLDIRGPLHRGEVQSHLTLKNYHQQQHRRRSWRLQAGFGKPILWCNPAKCNLCQPFDVAKKCNYNLWMQKWSEFETFNCQSLKKRKN